MGKLYFVLNLFLIPHLACGFVAIESLILGDVAPELSLELTGVPKNNKSDYYNLQKKARDLDNSCVWINKPKRITSNEYVKRLTSVIANLQYSSLNAISKNIAVLAKHKKITEEEFQILSDNIVTNYCSENLSVISKKELENNLNYFFNGSSIKEETHSMGVYNKALVNIVKKEEYIDNQLRAALQVFRGLCSWGGTSDDLGILNPFLKSPHVNSFILSEINSDNPEFKPVLCDNLICRPHTMSEDKKTAYVASAKSFYCHVFKKLPSRPGPRSETLKEWSKDVTSDDFIFQTFQLISALSNQPNLIALADGNNNKSIFSSFYDDYFQSWSDNKLEVFSDDLKYEEVLSLRRTNISQNGKSREISFDIDYGELDHARNIVGKVKTKFSFSLGQKLVKYIRYEFLYDENYSEKKEKLLKRVIKEHVIEKGNKIYSEYFTFLKKDYFYDQLALAIFDDISSSAVLKNEDFGGAYVLKFHYGVFAMNYIRNIKATEN